MKRVLDKYISEYGTRLYGLCFTLCACKHEADDLYQETWLKALKRFDSYDSSKPFEPWLTKICINTYRDFLKKKRLSPVTDAFFSNNEKDAVLENAFVGEQEDMKYVRDAVDKLPEKLRITVILFYFFDLGEKRTADVLKIPVGTVKSRLNKAKKILKEKLADEQCL